MLTREAVEAEVRRQGHAWFSKGDYNLNIVGLRKQPGTPNTFDDRITISYRESGVWRFESFAATTDPGTYWLQNPGRVDGTAILFPGQYRSCWEVGLHKGRYPALVQRGFPFKVWRDRNRDGTPDYTGPIYGNVVGLNLHHAGVASTAVEKWSAGCQVVARMADWTALWSIIEDAAAVWGPVLSYTLLDWQGDL